MGLGTVNEAVEVGWQLSARPGTFLGALGSKFIPAKSAGGSVALNLTLRISIYHDPKPTALPIFDPETMASSQLRSIGAFARQLRVPRRAFATTARQLEAAVPANSRTETSPALSGEAQTKPIEQAPNRVDIWSRSQKPRSKAMTGPRFEQTDFDVQVSWHA